MLFFFTCEFLRQQMVWYAKAKVRLRKREEK